LHDMTDDMRIKFLFWGIYKAHTRINPPQPSHADAMQN